MFLLILFQKIVKKNDLFYGGSFGQPEGFTMSCQLHSPAPELGPGAEEGYAVGLGYASSPAAERTKEA